MASPTITTDNYEVTFGERNNMLTVDGWVLVKYERAPRMITQSFTETTTFRDRFHFEFAKDKTPLTSVTRTLNAIGIPLSPQKISMAILAIGR